ncbi:unnamed protein product [Mycena citricolor]|uniref:Glycoside hydrolase family 5 protein n=1 Tax=Mycena citricolor TaxID=2018698 RepID=A0AAD2HA64_9AGAR|nr:unnamed protein product [Mycena citricolor]
MRGPYVVDATGNRFKLRGGNWHGGSGTYGGSGDWNVDANHHAGENASALFLSTLRSRAHSIAAAQCPSDYNTCLSRRSSTRSWSSASTLSGFSSRIMVHNTTVGDPSWVAANPQFAGMTALEVYDAVVDALTARGIAVILNYHTKTSIWCCGVDGNEWWDESQSLDAWAADWVMMVKRYKDNKRVIGADLYNEVRRDILTEPNWGGNNNADWWQASQLVADRIHLVNPDILIIVEGINWVELPVNGLPHSRPTLIPIAQLSHTTLVSHTSYTGPNHSGATGIGETTDPRYRDLSRGDLFAVLNSSASYVGLTADMHFTVPVWISEFGMEGRADTLQSEIGLCVLAELHRLPRADGCELRVLAARGVPQQRPEQWGDFIQSLYARIHLGDWDNGASKANCPDGQRLIGLSHESTRGLCTDNALGNLEATPHATEVVFDERHVTTDWASGYTKYTCPANYYVIGWAIRGTQVSTVMCTQANIGISGSGRTVWIDRGDNRADTLGGDFASGQYKGSCAASEVVAGMAFTTRDIPGQRFVRRVRLGKELGGILSLTINNATAQSQFSLSFTESAEFISPLKLDDSCQPARLQNWDRIQTFHVPRATGLLTQTVGQQRGGFRFLTIVSASADPLTISNISLAITFMPHWDDLRAYPGYFFAPDPGFHDIDFLTKIWHYRVQTNTIPPHTARQEPCPAGGGWSNDALGGAATGPILVDGAKRDRNIWPGDCGISTHTELVALSDMEPTKNSLMVMFRTQNLTTGALQYSGPPLNNQGSDTYISWSLIGTHNYFLYTGDLDFIKSVWANYTKAVGFLEGQVDLTGLMNVSSALSNDWGRASGAGHNSAANALLYRTLVTTADLATHLGNVSLPATYLANATKIKTAFNSLLWDAAAGRFRSNDLPRSIHPQDGNALAVLYNLTTSDAQNKAVSAGLMKFWTPIRPWLRAHFVAGKGERAIDLIEREWGYMLETNLSVKSPLLEGFSANGSLGRLPGVLIIASII